LKAEDMNFLKQLFSDSPGVSFGRFGCFLALVAGIVWVTRIVWKTNILPDLSGLTFFVSSLYLVGKGVGTVRTIFGKEGMVAAEPPKAEGGTQKAEG
jgi:hypothetical protein